MCKDLETVEILKIDSLTRLYRELIIAKQYMPIQKALQDSELQKEVENKLLELIKAQ